MEEPLRCASVLAIVNGMSFVFRSDSRAMSLSATASRSCTDNSVNDERKDWNDARNEASKFLATKSRNEPRFREFRRHVQTKGVIQTSPWRPCFLPLICWTSSYHWPVAKIFDLP